MEQIFQGMITANRMEMLQNKDFDIAYSRGIKNDPVNIKQKDLLRYRVFINASIARLAAECGGNFCSVGVSGGIVPRTIYQYLDVDNFWSKERTYFLIDKWEKVLFASEKNKFQEGYCGDISFVKNEFKEKNFQIIQKYAPEAFKDVKKKISYLHLNTGDKFSEFKSVELFYDQLTKPGFIVIDNYYYSDLEESIDGFLRKRKNFVLPLGNSQGIIIKT